MYKSLILLFVGCIAALCLNVCSIGQSNAADSQSLLQAFRQRFEQPLGVRASDVPFANPPEIHLKPGDPAAPLIVDYGTYTIAADGTHLTTDQQIRLRTYNGQLCGP